MKKTKKITNFAACLVVFLFLCNSVYAWGVNTYIGCNGGAVTATANGSAFSGFGYIEMDLWVTGPDYSSYKSTFGTGYVSLTDNAPFQYDQYYTVTACAYIDEDNGTYYACDTSTCVTPIEPTKKP
ncbi:MAG: hypothetical protein LUM44_02675 [Pyrinomonadaceae bacterium]|nr:hypothetical protein [Pyrinomonadaceae bacterium]